MSSEPTAFFVFRQPAGLPRRARSVFRGYGTDGTLAPSGSANSLKDANPGCSFADGVPPFPKDFDGKRFFKSS